MLLDSDKVIQLALPPRLADESTATEQIDSIDDVAQTPINERHIVNITNVPIAVGHRVLIYGFGQISAQAYSILRNLGLNHLDVRTSGIDYFEEHYGEYNASGGVICFVTPNNDSDITKQFGVGIFVTPYHPSTLRRLKDVGLKRNTNLNVPLANKEEIIPENVRVQWETLESCFAGIDLERDPIYISYHLPQGLPYEVLVLPPLN